MTSHNGRHLYMVKHNKAVGRYSSVHQLALCNVSVKSLVLLHDSMVELSRSLDQLFVLKM